MLNVHSATEQTIAICKQYYIATEKINALILLCIIDFGVRLASVRHGNDIPKYNRQTQL